MNSPRHWYARSLPVLLAALPPMACIQPNLVTAVLVLLGLLALCQGLPRLPVAGWRSSALAVLALMAWGMASAFWSADIDDSLQQGLRGLALALLGYAAVAAASQLDDRARARAGTGLLIGIGLALVILVVEVVADQPLAEAVAALGDQPFDDRLTNRGATLLTILLAPAVVLTWRRAGLAVAGLVTALALVAILGLPSLSAIAGLAASIMAFALIFAFGRPAALALGILLAGYILAAPVLHTGPLRAGSGIWAPADLPESAQQRLHIWEFAAQSARERPVAGWGLRAYRNLPKTKAAARTIASDYPVKTRLWFIEASHPHNLALQAWLELGALGAFLIAALACLALFGVTARAVPRSDAAAAGAAIVAYVAIGTTAYGMVQSQWVATAWLVALVLALVLARMTSCRHRHDTPALTGLEPSHMSQTGAAKSAASVR